jgi:hypothetical protein
VHARLQLVEVIHLRLLRRPAFSCSRFMCSCAVFAMCKRGI